MSTKNFIGVLVVNHDEIFFICISIYFSHSISDIFQTIQAQLYSIKKHLILFQEHLVSFPASHIHRVIKVNAAYLMNSIVMSTISRMRKKIKSGE
jgi:hypothetical protein